MEPAGDGKTVWALLPLEDPLPADDDEDEAAPVRLSAVTAGGPAPAGPLVQAAAA